MSTKIPMNKSARADVLPIRQRSQFSCMAASMAMSLGALGIKREEDEVNKVLGALPLQGAAWEQALATAQYYGCRATLVVPSTVRQLKEWTDQGIPVMIAWNPEGRDWSHASVVFDVDADLNVYVADPNIPDPDETVRVVSKTDFYAKWYEKWPKYMVRRPAMAITREVTSDGRQVMASSASEYEIEDPSGEEAMGKKMPEKNEKALEALSRIRGLERKEFFENGGTPTGWMGGPSSVTKNKSRYNRREKHKENPRDMVSRLVGRYLEAALNDPFEEALRLAENVLYQWAEAKWGSASRVSVVLERADSEGDLSEVSDLMYKAWSELDPSERQRLKRDFDRFWPTLSRVEESF